MWRFPMKVFESRSNLVSTVGDIVTHQHHMLHAQRMIPYPVTSLCDQASNALMEQVMDYDARYHLFQDIWRVCKPKQEYEILVY